jgi:periplasmic protein CpxP/Spy
MSEQPETPNPSPSTPDERPRRCRGRGALYAFLLVGVALAGALALTASGASGRGTFGRHPFFHGALTGGDAEKHVERMVQWLMDDLKGTPEQTRRMTDVAKAALGDLVPLKGELHANHQIAVELLSKPTVDRAALEALRVRQMALLETGTKRLAQAIADGAEILTADQKVALAERHKSRWGCGD